MKTKIHFSNLRAARASRVRVAVDDSHRLSRARHGDADIARVRALRIDDFASRAPKTRRWSRRKGENVHSKRLTPHESQKRRAARVDERRCGGFLCDGF